MTARHQRYIILFGLFMISFLQASPLESQTLQDSTASASSEKLELRHAAMCEDINGYSPKNTAIVFSIDIGKVSCFTLFDPVPKEMDIYHKWFYRDKLSTKKKLHLKPPRWSTFSSIQLREVDKGPWRVEVIADDGTIIQILRFSIVD